MKLNILCLGIILTSGLSSCSSAVQNDKSFNNKKMEDINFARRDLLLDTVFYLSKQSNLYEYQGNLWRFFPDLHEGDSVKIRQICEKKDRSKMYFWFKLKGGEWICFDNIEINDQAEF